MTVGPFQVLIILLVVLIMFGRGRIGQTMGEFGQGVRAFRKGLSEGQQPEPVALETSNSAERG
jgi:sec-independent protein translocase protein TatA